MLQIREEVGFTKGCIIVRGKLVTRGQTNRADYILDFKPGYSRFLPCCLANRGAGLGMSVEGGHGLAITEA